MVSRSSMVLLLTLIVGGTTPMPGQEQCIAYKLVPQTTYRTQPVTVSRWVNETVMEPQQITTYKPVWTRETRQRTTTVLKPIVKTSHREERYLVRRPYYETSYRERQIQETSYETVTEMREQRYSVQKPIVETQMREERVVVRKPVTTTMMQTENVTTYRPTTVMETQWVAGANVRNDLVLESGRNRLRWLRPGVYVDPRSGQPGYRKGGLHWVPDQNLAIRPTVEPTLTPQQVARTTYTPETVQVQKPVQVTQYVDQLETRKVPVQVTRTQWEEQIQKIPVTVQKPVTRTRVEKIPVREVKYREEVVVRRVPITETTYQRVEQVEPYEVQVCKWVTETKQVQVPRVVTRRVDYSLNQVVPQTTLMRVPVDVWGNSLSTPAPVPSTHLGSFVLPPAQVSPRIVSAPLIDSYGRPIVVQQEATTFGNGTQTVRKIPADTPTTSERKSVLVPETQTDPVQPNDSVTTVNKPPLATGDQSSENAGELDLEAPSIDDRDRQQAPLRIDSSDAADIDSRPTTGDRDDDEGPRL